MVNTKEGKGIAFIEGDTAIFKPDGARDVKVERWRYLLKQDQNISVIASERASA